MSIQSAVRPAKNFLSIRYYFVFLRPLSLIPNLVSLCLPFTTIFFGKAIA